MPGAGIFYDPRRLHYRHMIDDLLPGWHQEFGDQFKLIVVNTETRDGSKLFVIASETTETASPPLS